MTSISTHVLDTTRGCPAGGIPVTLEFQISDQEWNQLGKGTTDRDGRIRSFTSKQELRQGIYRLTFDVTSYQQGFYPRIVVVFHVENPAEHYHVPVLLSQFGYTTYRGS
jgi:5-hydroxyisourate hydrolase